MYLPIPAWRPLRYPSHNPRFRITQRSKTTLTIQLPALSDLRSLTEPTRGPVYLPIPPWRSIRSLLFPQSPPQNHTKPGTNSHHTTVSSFPGGRQTQTHRLGKAIIVQSACTRWRRQPQISPKCISSIHGMQS